MKRWRQALAGGPIRTWGANVEHQIVGPFAGGSDISVADIKLFVVGSWLGKGVLDHVPANVLSVYPKLQGLISAVQSYTQVAAWYRSA